jgi:hypothetical protein
MRGQALGPGRSLQLAVRAPRDRGAEDHVVLVQDYNNRNLIAGLVGHTRWNGVRRHAQRSSVIGILGE